MKSILLSITTVALLFATTNLFAQTYNIDVSKSKLEWLAKKVTGQHNGTVNIKSGSIATKNGAPTGGEFVIDMTSIAIGDLEGNMANKLKGHLESDDFFSVAKHPTATLTITNVTAKKGDGTNYEVTANLTIKGITNAITFPANIKLSNGQNTTTASFTIDRSKWDVRYGSGSFFDNLGDKTIYDDIEFTVNLSFEK